MRPDADIRVRAGSLRHYVTFNSLLPTSPPTYGPTGETLTWQPVFINVPAQIGPEQSTDVVRDGQTVTETTIPISVRYMDGINSSMRITWQNKNVTKTYTIRGAINFDERNVLIQFNCIAYGQNT
jgi:SPP1 family predicted phage head-tail adaptor